MSILDQFLKIAKDDSVKINRSAFLYLEPSSANEDEFAQCKTCHFFTGKACILHSSEDKVDEDDSCGFYINGAPRLNKAGKEKGLLTKEESGFFDGEVRCENCQSFDGKGLCNLFAKLNKELPDNFNLVEQVKAKACCNAFTPSKDSTK